MQITFFSVSKFVWSYLRRKPIWLSGVLFLVIFQTAAELAMPQLFGLLADTLAKFANETSAAFPKLWWILGGIGAAGLFFWTTNKGKNIFWDWRWLPMLKKIQTDAFFRVQRFSTDWHVNSFSGATVRKITRGVWAANSFVDQFLFVFIPLSILLLGMIVLMFWRWAEIGLIIAGGTAVYLIFSVFVVKKFVAPRARAATRTDTKIGATVADAVSCNATVKIFGRENFEDRRFERVVEKWRQRHWQLWTAFNLTDISQSFVMTAFKFALLIPIVIFWANGTATVGDAVFVLSSYNLIASHLRSIGERIRETQKAASEMEDLVEFSLMDFYVADRPGAQKLEIKRGAVEFRNVTFRYSNQKKPIYKNLSLKIEPGEKIALVGRSGGGKTTFVKLLQRLYDVQGGAILFDGQNISKITQKSLRRAVGVVPQEPILFHRSLAENIAYGRPDAKIREIKRAAKLAHADEFIAKLPEKYETYVGERGV
ncbi:MAG: ABC transporter ATP-binding protein/permease, partial [Candidatus Peribacteraceae bacterium]|nr:ABC transporter ATP-binding protein/permease [Candidatus Peribacteraceae bacterium]